MIITSFLLLSGICAADELPALENAMPARVAGPWSVEVGPGSVAVGEREISLNKAVTIEVEPPDIVRVRDEAHDELPAFDNSIAGWRKGVRLAQLVTKECSATGLLSQDSVRVKAGPGDAALLELGVDYGLDPFWATFGRIEGGAIAKGQKVFVDYDYSPHRLDSVLVDAAGKVRLAKGAPDVALALPPEPAEGEMAVVNVWVPGRAEKLTGENLYPIEFRAPPMPSSEKSVAERLLPKTLAKLRAGNRVTIVAWGDSVTNGGGVDGQPELRYQKQFLDLLTERFPEAGVEMLTAAWGGANSKMYMNAPRGGEHDFVRDVLEPKPDLVTIEFVNDAYLDEAGTTAHYGPILEQLRGIGAEVILITPHLVRPDWLGVNSLKVDKDPRPYVKGLRRFATDNQVALADASRAWRLLWRQGIPYITLLANSINHPDARGHAIFARALIDLFPE